MSKGILLFAKNNEKFNYVKQALVAGKFAKKHLGVKVCIVASAEELNTLNPKLRKQIFDDEIIMSPTIIQKRWFIAQDQTREELSWCNSLRPLAYELTPYDETILIDTDYIIQNNALKECWGSIEPILMNNEAINIVNKPTLPNEQRTSVFGPKMYWATCVYFHKSEKAEIFFNLIKHIQKNYLFYRLSYNLPSSLYRNDYAFTIAAHIINDTMEDGVPALPVPMLNSYFEDCLLEVTEDSILINSDIPVKVTGMNIHIMNKYSLEEHLDDLIRA